MNGGQWDRQHGRVSYIVDAHDPHIARDLKSFRQDVAHQEASYIIAGAHEPIAPGSFLRQVKALASFNLVNAPGRCVMRSQRLAVSSDPAGHRRSLPSESDEADPPGAALP